MQGYVYSLWSGRLKIQEATINNYPKDSRNAKLAYARFYNGGYVEVNQTPGQMHNAIVWLEERNDEIAIAILIEYERQQISKLQDKIENHEYKIRILQNSNKGGILA
jgi:hypothetical protein